MKYLLQKNLRSTPQKNGTPGTLLSSLHKVSLDIFCASNICSTAKEFQTTIFFELCHLNLIPLTEKLTRRYLNHSSQRQSILVLSTEFDSSLYMFVRQHCFPFTAGSSFLLVDALGSSAYRVPARLFPTSSRCGPPHSSVPDCAVTYVFDERPFLFL